MRKKLLIGVGLLMAYAVTASALPPKPGVFGERTRSEIGRQHARGLYTNVFPAKGEQHTIVVLVEFSDLEFSIPNPKDYFNRMLNEEGFSDYGATGSVKDFYTHCSNGKFDLTCDIYGPIKLSKSYAYYGGNYDIYGDENAYQMILDACNALDKEVDFAQYDRNDDGYIDNVYVIYAGYGEADGGGPLTIWPHSFQMILADPRYRHMYDGKRLNMYSCLNELQTDRTSTDLKPQGIGPFIHEFTHVMGFPDLYATDGNSNCVTPGEWSVMDVGAYNNDARTPPYFSCYEQYAFDWIEPHCLSGGQKELRVGEHYLLETTSPDEFYMLENRQPIGNDAFLPGHGLLVWHVDFNQKVWNDNQVNVNPAHQHVSLLIFNSGDFTCHNTPFFVDWDGQAMDFDLYDIQESEDGVISFRSEPCPDSAGIGLIETESFPELGNEDVIIYNLYGHRMSSVEALTPGIYILTDGSNSRKVIIR